MSLIRGTATILRADARAIPLSDNSVDLIVTSPPYFALRSYTDGGVHYESQIGSEASPAEFLDALIECTREWMRVLKPTGSIFVNLGDKYAGSDGKNNNGTGSSTLGHHHGGGGPHSAKLSRQSGRRDKAAMPRREASGAPPKSLVGIPWRYAIRCIDELGLILRAEIIWSKSNPLPESVRDRVRRSHETWFHFVLQPRYYSAIDTIREWTTENDSNPRSNGAMAAGNGWLDAPRLDMGSSGSTVEPCSLIELPTNCGWDPSQSACISTTCAGTASAATQNTSSPSPCVKTCSVALSLSQVRTQLKLTADMGMSTTEPTRSSSPLQENECAACARVSVTDEDTGPNARLGRLPGSVREIPSEPLTVPQRLGVDHFAAFPTAWPKWIIQGWSPAGICAECEKGRMNHAPETSQRTVSRRDQGDGGLHRLREDDGSAGLRPSREDDEALSHLAASGSLDLQGDRRSDEVRRAVREMPHAEALGRGREGAAERQEAASLLLRQGVDGARDVSDALHEMAASRDALRQVRKTDSLTCACPTPDAPTRPSVIVDPFGGTGTTALVAKALGRHGISVDLSHDYSRLAQWRTNDPAQLAKILEVPKPPQQTVDQLDLFGGDAA